MLSTMLSTCHRLEHSSLNRNSRSAPHRTRDRLRLCIHRCVCNLEWGLRSCHILRICQAVCQWLQFHLACNHLCVWQDQHCCNPELLHKANQRRRTETQSRKGLHKAVLRARSLSMWTYRLSDFATRSSQQGINNCQPLHASGFLGMQCALAQICQLQAASDFRSHCARTCCLRSRDSFSCFLRVTINLRQLRCTCQSSITYLKMRNFISGCQRPAFKLGL